VINSLANSMVLFVNVSFFLVIAQSIHLDPVRALSKDSDDDKSLGVHGIPWKHTRMEHLVDIDGPKNSVMMPCCTICGRRFDEGRRSAQLFFLFADQAQQIPPDDIAITARQKQTMQDRHANVLAQDVLPQRPGAICRYPDVIAAGVEA
jgi:hypothetical protein